MAKRYTDTTIWKNQRWFKKLSPIYKLAWKYLTDTCDHAGILKIDFSEFVDDLGLDEFDIFDFIKCCNTDFDKSNGKKIERERIKLLKNNTIWITGFIKFQYENKDFHINPSIPAIYSALTILNSYGTLNEGLSKGYFTLSKPYVKGMLRTKDKDKDKDKDKKEVIKEKDQKFEIDMNIYNAGTIGKMVKIFKKYNPNYPEDLTKDSTAILQMATKIGKSNGWSQSDILNGKQEKVLDNWEEVVDFIVSDKWFSTRSLFDLNNEWQRLMQSMNKLNTKPTSGKAKLSSFL